MSQTKASPATGRGASPLLWSAPVGVVGLLVGAAFLWSAPREDVAVPGPDATPEQVVNAYNDAVNARDFDTANVIDARPGSDLTRFSRPGRTHGIKFDDTVTEHGRAHVVFRAEVDGGDGTVEDGRWGYYLERGSDGSWHITDAGVA